MTTSQEDSVKEKIMIIDKEIKELDSQILEMAGLVEENLKYAIDVYLNYDPVKVYNPVDDDKVNMDERVIEKNCLHLMLKERLFAEDLRQVTGILSMVQDLERLGDHAKDILEFALRLKNPFRRDNRINDLTQFVYSMVEKSIQSYLKRDTKLAKEVIKDDDHVDEEYASIIQDLIEKEKSGEITSSYAIYSALVVKYLERIGDHATNVSEWAIYIITGYYKDLQII